MEQEKKPSLWGWESMVVRFQHRTYLVWLAGCWFTLSTSGPAAAGAHAIVVGAAWACFRLLHDGCKHQAEMARRSAAHRAIKQIQAMGGAS